MGRTQIRFLDPHHAVAPAQKIENMPPLLAHLMKPQFGWFYVALAIGGSVLGAYEELVSTDNTGSLLTMAASFAAMILLGWSAPWAVASQFLRRKSYFSAHMAMAGLYLCASIVLWQVVSIVAFLTSDGMFATGLQYVLNAMAFGLLLDGALRLCAHMPPKKRRAGAAFFSCGLFALVFAIGYATQQSFDETPNYATTLKPYLAELAPAETAQDFVTQSGLLFKDRHLSVKQPEQGTRAKILKKIGG
jgi:hypothetical protein